MEPGEAIRSYIKESIQRKGTRLGGSYFRDSIDEVVQYYFKTLTVAVEYPPPQNLKEYIRKEVSKTLQVELKKKEILEAKRTSGNILVHSLNPPSGYIDGILQPFAHLKPVKIGFTYPYNMYNDLPIVQGDFEGSVGKAQRYTLPDDNCTFYFHPRDNLAPGGRDPKGDPLEDKGYLYPLIDNDKGTKGLTKDGTEWVLDFDPSENYGNIDWVGLGGEILSWRGPSTRQLKMDATKSFPGLTVFDYESIQGGAFYTPFSVNIYQDGDILKTFPTESKVLGAAKFKGKLIVVINTDYAERTNPEGGIGGFYNEVWLGQECIGFNRGSRPATPWFFNATGSEAVNNSEVLKLTILEDPYAVQFTALPAGTGTLNLDPTRDAWDLSATGAWPISNDFLINQATSLSLLLSRVEKTVLDLNSDSTSTQLPIKYSGPAHDTVTISGPYDYSVPAAYTYSLTGGISNCPIIDTQWSYPSGCGMSTVSVVLTFLGGAQLSGSKTVKMPTGVWVFSHVVGTMSWWCSDYGYPYSVDLYQGSQKFVVSVQTCGLLTPGTNCSSGVVVSGEAGGWSGTSQRDGWAVYGKSGILSFPCTTGPHTATDGCGWGCGGWNHAALQGSCGVCGYCGGPQTAVRGYYAAGYSVYNWVCP